MPTPLEDSEDIKIYIQEKLKTLKTGSSDPGRFFTEFKGDIYNDLFEGYKGILNNPRELDIHLIESFFHVIDNQFDNLINEIEEELDIPLDNRQKNEIKYSLLFKLSGYLSTSISNDLTPENLTMIKRSDLLTSLAQKYFVEGKKKITELTESQQLFYTKQYEQFFSKYSLKIEPPYFEKILDKENFARSMTFDSDVSLKALPQNYQEQLKTALWKRYTNISTFFPDAQSFETLFKTTSVADIYKVVKQSDESSIVKNNFKKHLLNYQLENLKVIPSWQEPLLKRKAKDSVKDVELLDKQQWPSKEILKGIQYIILDTKWDIGYLGGVKVIDTETGLQNKIPKGMNVILKEIKKAQESNDWTGALDKVEAIIKASSEKKSHVFLNQRGETTQDFYDKSKKMLNDYREENTSTTSNESSVNKMK